MLKKFVLGQIRHAMTAGGGSFSTWLIANGASLEQADVIIGGIITALGFAWSAWDKYWEMKKAKKEKLES